MTHNDAGEFVYDVCETRTILCESNSLQRPNYYPIWRKTDLHKMSLLFQIYSNQSTNKE